MHQQQERLRFVTFFFAATWCWPCGGRRSFQAPSGQLLSCSSLRSACAPSLMLTPHDAGLVAALRGSKPDLPCRGRSAHTSIPRWLKMDSRKFHLSPNLAPSWLSKLSRTPPKTPRGDSRTPKGAPKGPLSCPGSSLTHRIDLGLSWRVSGNLFVSTLGLATSAVRLSPNRKGQLIPTRHIFHLTGNCGD